MKFFRKKILVTSTGILRTPLIEEFLASDVCFSKKFFLPWTVSAVAGWGAASSGVDARLLAEKIGVPALFLEDGFLRSVFPGYDAQPWSMVKDEIGIYYDSTKPSTLENLFNADCSPLEGVEDAVAIARNMVLDNRLSKYNHAPRMDRSLFTSAIEERILVIDQTLGDRSVTLGEASEETFSEMLSAALLENPKATIYVKTHPEVASGKKRGYLSHVAEGDRIRILGELINPIDLISEMDRVYCVTSTMGFEALLAGKPVTCFGVPWYAGWGATDDRKIFKRRVKHRSVDELFAGAYFKYSVYLNPYTGKRGSIFDVISWLIDAKPN